LDKFLFLIETHRMFWFWSSERGLFSVSRF